MGEQTLMVNMRFVHIASIVCTAITAVAASPVAGSSTSLRSWCCEDQGKQGCTAWDSQKNQCQSWQPGKGNNNQPGKGNNNQPGKGNNNQPSKGNNQGNGQSWCNNWDSGKGCCEDQGKQGCTAWDSQKNQCQSWQPGKGNNNQ